MHVSVVAWVLQIFLAAVFLGAGATKVSQPKEKLQPRMGWVEGVAPGHIKLLATAELIGAIGLVLPWATGIARVLTPLAAVGLAVVMAGAVLVHRSRKEPWYAQLVLLIACLVVAIVRF
ncbi:MAG TPA: DoxX family protein [Micromonosporaceae bacterium]|jgi:uncharacterized membrane protein YphA (DoxX/SURF4 family)|nr:DoxX family protein [Micromonosporaceae bacterium]